MIQAISDAIDKVKSDKYSGSGRVCCFYKVSDNTGAKVFSDETIARKNMESQITLHKLGIAPEVRSDVIKFKNKKLNRYMFLTELAKTVFEICIEEGLANECCYKSRCSCDMDDISCDFIDEPIFNDIGDLFIKMEELGLSDLDNHWGNYGYLEDGTPVVIDCEFYHLYPQKN